MFTYSKVLNQVKSLTLADQMQQNAIYRECNQMTKSENCDNNSQLKNINQESIIY